MAQRLGGFGGLVPIALHHDRAAHADLAHGAVGHLVSILVEQPHLVAHAGRATGGQAFGVVHRVMLMLVQHRHRVGRLRLGIELHEHRAEHLQAFGQPGGRHRRGAVDDQLQAAQVGRGPAGVIEQHVDHRRHQEGGGDAVLLHQVAKLVGGETLRHRVGAAFQQHRHDHRARGMGDRRQRQEADLHRPVPVGHLGEDHRDMHPVGVRHALGLAGGAAGVDQHADVVRLRLRHQPPRGEGGSGGQHILTQAVIGAEAEQTLHTRHPCGQRAGPLGEAQRVDEQRGDAGVFQDVGVVGLRRGGVHPGQPQAHHIRRGGDQKGLGPVGRQRSHRVTTLQPPRAECLDHGADQRAKLAVGPAGVFMDEGHPVAATGDCTDHQVTDGAAFVQRLGGHAGAPATGSVRRLRLNRLNRRAQWRSAAGWL